MLEKILSSSFDSVNSQNSSYSLDKDLRFREPGDDDGPALTVGDPAWREADPWDEVLTILKDALPVQTSLYLDNNAQVGGYEKQEEIQELTEAEIRGLIAGEMARANICLKTAAHFEGSETLDMYHHVLNCRKPWCEICGGKQGVISKTRKKAVRKRIDVKEYGIGQFVLSVPPSVRDCFQSRKGLNKLFRDAQQLVAKYFGDLSRAKRNPDGSVDRYSFGDVLAIGYAHLFGDPDKKGNYRMGTAGTFHPHINVHVFMKSDDLRMTPENLELIRKDWNKKLLKYKKFDGEVDIHYLYVKRSAKDRKKYHKVKYMVKPYLLENIQKVIEEDNLELLKLLTIELKGFQFLRFWGGLSNVKKAYRDEAGIYPDNIDEIENRIKEKLIFRKVTEWDLKSFIEADDRRESEGKKRKLKRIAENFYYEKIGERG